MNYDQKQWMIQAVDLAVQNVRDGRGGPFAALVVKSGRLIASGANLVTSSNDPTAHAEVVAIRSACRELGTFQLTGCEIYTSCEPCPMCLGAIYWARPSAIYFAGTRTDAAQAGFDDAFIYDELTIAPEKRIIPGHRLLPETGLRPFVEWAGSQAKTKY